MLFFLREIYTLETCMGVLHVFFSYARSSSLFMLRLLGFTFSFHLCLCLERVYLLVILDVSRSWVGSDSVSIRYTMYAAGEVCVCVCSICVFHSQSLRVLFCFGLCTNEEGFLTEWDARLRKVHISHIGL